MARGNRRKLTKYVVGAKANPPKNPRSPPKNGKMIPTIIVKAASNRHYKFDCMGWDTRNEGKLTNIKVSASKSQVPCWLESTFLYQVSLKHVKHWYCIELHRRDTFE